MKIKDIYNIKILSRLGMEPAPVMWRYRMALHSWTEADVYELNLQDIQKN